MKAVDKFEYRRGFRLWDIRTWQIRQAVSRSVVDYARTIRIPARIAEAHRKFVKTSRQLKKSAENRRKRRSPRSFGAARKMRHILKPRRMPYYRIDAAISAEAEAAPAHQVIRCPSFK